MPAAPPPAAFLMSFSFRPLFFSNLSASLHVKASVLLTIADSRRYFVDDVDATPDASSFFAARWHRPQFSSALVLLQIQQNLLQRSQPDW